MVEARIHKALKICLIGMVDLAIELVLVVENETAGIAKRGWILERFSLKFGHLKKSRAGGFWRKMT